MRQVVKLVLKGVLLIALFTGGSVVLSTKGIKTVSEANAASYSQVNEYLVSHGYTVVSLAPKSGSMDWTAQTSKNLVRYTTTVYCTETSIVGNTDMPL
ncbi:MAG: hypothetical protein K0Q95_2371 [Bacteroidota bacterium]|jgi:hypothetical protein|nr:hypothetical protein [Bacteroidota bacterium]